LDCLEKSQAQMKEYQTLQKKLQSRRQDYDAKLAKVQKAKKEKPEWEEEMQAAKAKYEETRENVLNLIAGKKKTHASSARFAPCQQQLFISCFFIAHTWLGGNTY
jgi:chromosome segregation ATPase